MKHTNARGNRRTNELGCKIVQKLNQRSQRERRVCERVTAPGNPFIGQNIDEDERRVQDVADGRPQRPRQRCDDRPSANCTNRKFGSTQLLLSLP